MPLTVNGGLAPFPERGLSVVCVLLPGESEGKGSEGTRQGVRVSRDETWFGARG